MKESGFEGFFEKLERVQLECAALIRELSDIPFASSVPGGARDWSEPLSAWWRRERGGADPELVTLYEKLVEHGRVLFLLAERLGEQVESGEELEALLKTFQQTLSECLVFDKSSGANMFSPMGHLVDTWQRQAGAVFGLPGNFARDFPDAIKSRNAEDLKAALSGFVDPGEIAASRLRGADFQALATALVDYQDSFNRFARLAVKATADTVARMESERDALGSDEAPGVRELYDSWLRCCEQSYDDLARDPEFARLMGELVNGAVRVRAARQRIADATAESLGLPTRRDVRELSASLHHARRRLSRMERGIAPTGLANPLANSPRKPAPFSEPRQEPVAASPGVPQDTENREPSLRRKPSRGKASGKKTTSGKPAAGKSVKKKSVKTPARKKTTRRKSAAGEVDAEVSAPKTDSGGPQAGTGRDEAKSARRRKTAGSGTRRQS